MPSRRLRSDIIDIEHDDAPADDGGDGEKVWKVLVVDDDDDVQLATRHVLSRERILGRPLALIAASSVASAMDAMDRHPDFAVILLDIVMEEHDSGLKFARWLRLSGFRNVRVILRTGQPGYAPELEIIRDYDVNDFRSKNEFDRTRIVSSLTAAVRAFEQIERLHRLAYVDEELGIPNRNRLLEDIDEAPPGTPLTLVRLLDYSSVLERWGRAAAAAQMKDAVSRVAMGSRGALYRYSDDALAMLGSEIELSALLSLLRGNSAQNGGVLARAVGIGRIRTWGEPAMETCSKAEMAASRT